MNKGELMQAVYSKEELRNIDSAIPMELWKKVETYSHVMNYNEPNRQGKLENMYDIAKQRNITLIE